MKFAEFTIQQLAESQDVSIGYSDDDIIIIDNVNTLIAPTSAQLKMNLLVICTNGRAQGNVDNQPISMEKNDMFISPPNMTFGDFMMSPDFQFKAMFFTSHILQSFLREKMSIWNEMMYIHHKRMVKMSEKDAELYSLFYDLLSTCINEAADTPFRTEIIQSLLRASLLVLCSRMKQMLADAPHQQMKQAGNLFQRFLNLLEQQPVKHRTVESYAAELFITPKYLSAVCKKQSGKTANEWITQQVLADIRYYLKQTDLSIKQICNRLGFPNPSFFGKYVKEHFGMTPTQFRNSQPASSSANVYNQ